MKKNKIPTPLSRNISFDVNKFFNRISPFVYTIIILIFFLTAFGQVARWDLGEQVSMADNYVVHNALYPSVQELPNEIIHGVSIYFPGVSFIAIFLEKILSVKEYLFELLLIIATLITIAFVFIQVKIAKKLTGDQDGYFQILPYVLCYMFMLCNTYQLYVLEFKPDTIAFLIGFTGLFLGFPIHKPAFGCKQVIAAIMVGAAIVFKQQYISFIFGLCLYSFFYGKMEMKMFALTSAIVAALVILGLYKNEKAWFWTITILSDDGFLSIKEFIIENDNFFVTVVFFVVACVVLSGQNTISFSLEKVIKNIRNEKNSFLMLSLFISFPSFLLAFLSSVKNGGNSGNIQFGLFLLFPVAYLYMRRIPKIIPFVAICFVITGNISGYITSTKKYKQAKELKGFAATLKGERPKYVLTGSNTYYAARTLLNENVRLDNYWAVSIRKNILITDGLKKMLHNKVYDIIIIENWPEIAALLAGYPKYKIVFQNEVGIIARAAD